MIIPSIVGIGKNCASGVNGEKEKARFLNPALFEIIY